MPNSVGTGNSLGGAEAVIILGLLTFADNALTSALPVALGPGPPQTPGFWNLTATSLVLSVVADLIGQPILTNIAYKYKINHAINLNIFSIAIAALVSLFLTSWRNDGWASAFAIVPVFKMIGGGSHATIFLTIVDIRNKTSGSLRTCMIYTTGTVVVLYQTISSSFVPILAERNLTLPYIFAIVCCSLAAWLVYVFDTEEIPVDSRGGSSESYTQPLLSPPASTYDVSSSIPLGFIRTHSYRWQNKSSNTRSVMKILGLVFLLAAIAKATRPLFITYIQHRVGVTPDGAGCLWLVRTIMSLVIFSAVLPSAVVLWCKSPFRLPSTLNLYIAKVSIVLIGSGAILIGMAITEPVLVTGLVINTLGVATDLALLAFAGDAVPENIATFFFMVLAYIESAGTLVGIAVLYPLYQAFLDDKTLLGGIPYYVCGGLFMISAILVWSLKPLVSS